MTDHVERAKERATGTVESRSLLLGGGFLRETDKTDHRPPNYLQSLPDFPRGLLINLLVIMRRLVDVAIFFRVGSIFLFL